MITYRSGNDIDLNAMIALYKKSNMGPRRPVDDAARMAQMLKNANLVITAWDADRLVGIARNMTDFVYCTYLSDLCVDEAYQRNGIGRELIRQTRDHAPQAMLILLAAPAAVGYYPRVGFKPHNSAWIIKPGEELI